MTRCLMCSVLRALRIFRLSRISARFSMYATRFFMSPDRNVLAKDQSFRVRLTMSNCPDMFIRLFSRS